MKKLFFFLIVLLFSTQNLKATEQVYYLDIDYVLNNSSKGKDIINYLKQINSKNLKELKIYEDELKKLENEIDTVKNILTQEELNKKINILKTKFNQYKVEKDKKTVEFTKLKNDKLNNFLKEITPKIKQYMHTNEISVILDKKNVLIADNNFDLTDKIVQLLNETVNN